MKNLIKNLLDFNESKKTIYNNTILDFWFVKISKTLNENDQDLRRFIKVNHIKWKTFIFWKRKRLNIYLSFL